jgi:hypothetical protein
MKRSPVPGITWQKRQFASRPATISRPRVGSPAIAVIGWGIASPCTASRAESAVLATHPAMLADSINMTIARLTRTHRFRD